MPRSARFDDVKGITDVENSLECSKGEVIPLVRRPKDLYNDLILQVLQQSLKMLVVRHPFARLLSAYRDKLEHNTAERARHGAAHFFRKYGRKIVAKYRKQGDENHKPEPTFQEFVK